MSNKTIMEMIKAAGGVENLRFFAKMCPLTMATPFGFGIYSGNSEDMDWTECRVSEDRYKVKDGYKITLVPIDAPIHGKEHYYQSDFLQLLEAGCIIWKTSENQHVEQITWEEPLVPGMNLRHTATIVANS